MCLRSAYLDTRCSNTPETVLDGVDTYYGVTSQHYQSPNDLEGHNSRHGIGVARHSKNSATTRVYTQMHATWYIVTLGEPYGSIRSSSRSS